MRSTATEAASQAPDRAGALPVGLELRLAAAEKLAAVLGGTRFVPFSSAEIADSRDRAQANRLVTVTLRRHGHLDLVLAHLLERGLPARAGHFEALLRLGLAQLLFLPEIGAHSAIFLAVEAAKRDRRAAHLGKLLNAVLRRAQREAASLRTLPPQALLPSTLRDGWIAHYGEAAMDRFAEALLASPPLDLVQRDDDPVVTDALGGVPVLADVLRLERRDRAVEQLPFYAEGRWWVQDLASSLPARLIELPRGARVLDLCAAPGGKTAQLAKAGYAVTALDSDQGRLDRLKGNLDRLGYAVTVVCADAESYEPGELYDAVLLDAPCSATGTFRRHPEVIWHRQSSDIAGRVALQRRLLVHAAGLVAPGGVLVYCVCSLENAEGEAQADWAAATLTGFRLDPLRGETFPMPAAIDASGRLRTHPGMSAPGGSGSMDGFFAVRFRRN